MVYPRNTNQKTQFPIVETKEMHQLMDCMSICRACSKKCLDEGDKRLASLCQDCSEICDLAIKLKSSDSDYCHQVLDLCAQVCRRCANECNHMPSAHCQECAEVCRHCAEACAAMPTYR
jgi:hypothetical protein